MRRLLLRLDANHEIGLGHAIRVAGILSLMKTGHRVTVAGEGTLLQAFFPGAEFLDMPKDNRNLFFALAEKVRPDLVVVDHPRPGEGFWERLAESPFPVIAIDDEGGKVDADFIVNGTVLDEYHTYPNLRPGAELYCGTQYSLIRPAFGQSCWQDPAQPRVLIVAGSGDRAKDWALHLVSGQVDMTGWGQVSMVVGRAFPEMERLKRGCESLGIALDSNLSGEEMANRMSHVTAALLTGGMVVYEALAVGVPAVVFPQIGNLVPEAAWFEERRCISNLGNDGGMDGALVSEKVHALLDSPPLRRAMSSAARTIVDGRGMQRAAEIFDRVLGK